MTIEGAVRKKREACQDGEWTLDWRSFDGLTKVLWAFMLDFHIPVKDIVIHLVLGLGTFLATLLTKFGSLR